ncbi:carotenoid 1,2-hydratase [Clostridium sp. SHJSY1]|uniref:lipocalin-like domain-containing protein n=1 Tax=Clostridium sp. SHJSY1 TaxID=2942483 RepID=UPI002876FE63|nr:lipocalin-like domain-containing protein [Clostridium sp. SHJSY1]MDS0526695.1 carotenoid 1,2-hydratase [Clostridium sp. SHJSY1]
MRKNLLPNQGVPLSVDYKKDLPGKLGACFDSWYVICDFEYEGEKLGFEWHHQTINLGEMGVVNTAEFLLMNGTKNICFHNALTEPVSKKNGVDVEKMCVYSSWGEFSGNHNKMKLKLEVEDAQLDVVLTPKKEVLYNGTTGLLHFIGADSHQFSFPNMDIEGTLVTRGKEYKIKNTTAWFDRQWGYTSSDKESVVPMKSGVVQLAWLWLGMTLNEDNSEAISLWDAYGVNGKNAFATILKKDGTQRNVLVDITYDEIWTSKKSGRNYPRIVNVSIPSEELNLKLESMIDDSEFVRNGVELYGCQTLCNVTGSYKGKPIERNVVLEMIGDICGEE